MTKLITDTGEQITSELLKSIGCPYWSYLSDAELDAQFPPPKKPTACYTEYTVKKVETTSRKIKTK
jgi:hypothetical protein